MRSLARISPLFKAQCTIQTFNREAHVSRRSRQRRNRRTPASTIFLRVAGVLLGVVLLLTAAGAATAVAAVTTWLKGLPDYTNPKAFEIAQPTKIFSADGKLLAKLY